MRVYGGIGRDTAGCRGYSGMQRDAAGHSGMQWDKAGYNKNLLQSTGVSARHRDCRCRGRAWCTALPPVAVVIPLPHPHPPPHVLAVASPLPLFQVEVEAEVATPPSAQISPTGHISCTSRRPARALIAASTYTHVSRVRPHRSRPRPALAHAAPHTTRWANPSPPSWS